MLFPMSQAKKKPAVIGTPSPCIERCKIVERTGVCRGCGRTRDEISGWASASEERRQAILSELKSRAPLMIDDDEGPSW